MINLFDKQSQDYSKNRDKCTDDTQPCIICGKPVKNPRYMVHVHEGGASLVTETEAQAMDDNADLGLYPIGVKCLKNNPDLQQYLSIYY